MTPESQVGMIQSTVHCNKRWCHRWAPYDPEDADDLPTGWVLVVLGNTETHFCGARHAADWLAWQAVAAVAADPALALAQM